VQQKEEQPNQTEAQHDPKLSVPERVNTVVNTAFLGSCAAEQVEDARTTTGVL